MDKKIQFKSLSMDEVVIASNRHFTQEPSQPRLSAGRCFALWQTFFLGGLTGAVVFGFYHNIHFTLQIIGTLIVLIFTIMTFLKLVIYFLDLFKPMKAYRPSRLLSDEELPTYSVVLALYQEAEIIPMLLTHLMKFDYPKDKVEYFFMLEADDEKTIHALVSHTIHLTDRNITVLTIPNSYPKTKPKALNCALPYLTGQYCVVYDAEDRPDKMQLRLSASSFVELPAEVSALQARLSFFNAGRNSLTKMFAIEYDIWFHQYLSGLSRLGLPIPLAGTSTHFRNADLHHVGGWDAYNVTEDCDLGMRFARLGMKTLMLDSDTLEEAPIYIDIWFKQRTRWLKGYMQTQFVHTAQIFDSISSFGMYQFLGLWAVVGGQVLSAFLHPVAILCFTYQVFAKYFLWDWLFPPYLHPLMAFLLITGAFLVPLQAEAVYRRLKRRKSLWLMAFMHPFYWLFASFASYRALIQLITCPSHWEKTRHGLDESEQDM